MNNRLRLGIDGLLLEEILFGFLCSHCFITDMGYWTASPMGRPKGLLGDEAMGPSTILYANWVKKEQLGR